MKPVAATTAVLFGALALAAPAASAAEIRIASTPTLKSSLAELAPKFEKATGHRLIPSFDAVAALKKQIDGGATFDLVLLLPGLIDDLVKEGKVAAGARADIARAAVGVAVHKGVAKVDVSSVDAFKKTLLGAHAIAYREDSASGKYFIGLVERLAMTPAIAPKLKKVSGNVVEAVGRGEADLTVITVPNIVNVNGIDMGGLLPASLQHFTIFSAGILASSHQATAARTFLEFLLSPEATAVFASKGLERVSN